MGMAGVGGPFHVIRVKSDTHLLSLIVYISEMIRIISGQLLKIQLYFINAHIFFSFDICRLTKYIFHIDSMKVNNAICYIQREKKRIVLFFCISKICYT